jgi:uncharacterized membrane protein YdjX (TVP38/TMEM64 family)
VRALRPLVAGALFALVVVAIARSGVFADVSAHALRARIESWGALAPFAFIALMVAGFFLPGPEIVLVALGGAVFGATEGFVYSWIGAVVGTFLPFLVVRHGLGRYTQRPDGVRFARLRAIDDRLVERGFATVVLLRLLLFLAPPLNWALGATRVRVRNYVLGTAVGITPGVGVASYFGDALTEAGASSRLLSAEVLVPAVLILVLLVAGFVRGRRLLGG